MQQRSCVDCRVCVCYVCIGMTARSAERDQSSYSSCVRVGFAGVVLSAGVARLVERLSIMHFHLGKSFLCSVTAFTVCFRLRLGKELPLHGVCAMHAWRRVVVRVWGRGPGCGGNWGCLQLGLRLPLARFAGVR